MAVWFWFAYAAMGVLLVILAWYGNRRRRLSPVEVEASIDEAACGRCGYSVRGLPGPICPECGADLEEVGLTTAKFHRWQAAPLLVRGPLWTVAVLCVALVAGNIATKRFPLQRFESSGSRTLSARLLRSSSRRRPSIAQVVASTSDGVSGRRRPIVVEARDVLGSNTLQWDALQDTWRLRTAARSSSGDGRPTLKVIDDLIEAWTGEAAADMPTVDATWTPLARAGSVPPPEILRLYVHLYLFWAPPEQLNTLTIETDLGETIPDGWFNGETDEAFRVIDRFRPARTTSTVEHFDYLQSAVAFGWWPVVWLAGLPFVLRRKVVRVRPKVDAAGT